MEVSTCIGQHTERSQLGSQCMCLGKRRGGLRLSGCAGQVAAEVATPECAVLDTHTALLRPRAAATSAPQRDCHGNVGEPSEKLTYALQWCQAEIPGTSSGPSVQLSFLGVPDVLHHWLRAALCCSEALLAIFALVRRLTSLPPPGSSLPNRCCGATWPSAAPIPPAMPSPAPARLPLLSSPKGSWCCLRALLARISSASDNQLGFALSWLPLPLPEGTWWQSGCECSATAGQRAKEHCSGD